MSVERHLIFQELILRPSGEWTPGGHCWTVARVAEGSGYWMQGANTRALNAGDGLVLGFNGGGLLRASQLGLLKLQFFTVPPQFLNGFLTVAEWRSSGNRARRRAPARHFFHRARTGRTEIRAAIANQSHGDGLAMRCALLQLWAGAVTGLFPSPTPSPPGINKLRDRFHQIIGQMLEAELSGSSLCELAARLHCSERTLAEAVVDAAPRDSGPPSPCSFEAKRPRRGGFRCQPFAEPVAQPLKLSGA